MSTIAPQAPAAYLTPPEAAKILKISPDKILGWIKRGLLRATNISDGILPRWRIHPDDLRACLAARQPHPPTPRPKRRKSAAEVDFFPDIS